MSAHFPWNVTFLLSEPFCLHFPSRLHCPAPILSTAHPGMPKRKRTARSPAKVSDEVLNLKAEYEKVYGHTPRGCSCKKPSWLREQISKKASKKDEQSSDENTSSSDEEQSSDESQPLKQKRLHVTLKAFKIRLVKMTSEMNDLISEVENLEQRLWDSRAPKIYLFPPKIHLERLLQLPQWSYFHQMKISGRPEALVLEMLGIAI